MKVADLKKYKDGLYTSLSRDLDAFEKNFILISSGVLAFSITFIKDIVKIEDANCLFLLFIGWFFILSSVGLMMYAFLSSVNGSNELWKIVDDYIITNNKFDSDSMLSEGEASIIKKQTNDALYKIKKRLKFFRMGAIASFLLGVALFSTFVGINLYKENTKEKVSSKIESKNRLEIISGNIEILSTDSSIIIKH